MDTNDQHSENSKEDSDLSEVEWDDSRVDKPDSILAEPSLKVKAGFHLNFVKTFCFFSKLQL